MACFAKSLRNIQVLDYLYIETGSIQVCISYVNHQSIKKKHNTFVSYVYKFSGMQFKIIIILFFSDFIFPLLLNQSAQKIEGGCHSPNKHII